MAEQDKSFEEMTEHELLQVAEWHAQAMERSGIIDEDILAECRRNAEKDADSYGNHWQHSHLDLYKKLQYLAHFADKMGILRKKHLITLLGTPEWYTKIRFRINKTDDNLEIDDKMYDDFDAVRHECYNRIDRLIKDVSRRIIK